MITSKDVRAIRNILRGKLKASAIREQEESSIETAILEIIFVSAIQYALNLIDERDN